MRHGEIYAYPKLGAFDAFGVRVGNAGLCNMLFPFARCLLFSKKWGVKRINPTWPAVTLGPILRRERDTRVYWDLFNDGFGISGWRKTLLLCRAHRINEEELSGSEPCAIAGETRRPAVVVFKGMPPDAFSSILRDHRMVRDEILKITRSRHLDRVAEFSGRGIGVHVRLGDYRAGPPQGTTFDFLSSWRMPLSWYVAMVDKIRQCAGWDVPVHLFSDGEDAELRPLLNLPRVNRTFLGSAIADVLALSKCEVLVASCSTFSMWASYLGRNPTLKHPHQNEQKLFYEEGLFEGQIDEHDPLPQLLKANLRRLFGRGPLSG